VDSFEVPDTSLVVIIAATCGFVSCLCFTL